MPNSRSAKKRLRQDMKRRAHNRTIRSSMRTQIRKVRERIAADDAEGAGTELRLAVKRLDQASAKRVIHRNTAARMKSKLARSVQQMQAGSA